MNQKKANRKNKKSAGKNNRRLRIFLFIVLVLGFCAWYVCGKPVVSVSEDGSILIELTEEPIVSKLFSSEQQESVFAKTESSQTESEPVTVAEASPEKKAESVKTKTVKKSSSKNEYSFEGDLNHPENSPLYFGNPSDSIKELSSGNNYLIEKPQFTICYNNETLIPNWVSWHLSSADFGEAGRSNKFIPDKELPSDWYAVTSSDYKYTSYGFDRGHICPSADRTATQEDNNMTFLMSNMVPQAPDCNRIVWMHLESYERKLAEQGNEVYIIAGPYGTGGIGDKGSFDQIPIKTKDGKNLNIKVPAYTWKVLLVLPSGENDLERITADTTVIAACVPNRQGIAKEGDWDHYVCSVDYIEELTGYDFFELIPDEIEDILEAKVYSLP